MPEVVGRGRGAGVVACTTVASRNEKVADSVRVTSALSPTLSPSMRPTSVSSR